MQPIMPVEPVTPTPQWNDVPKAPKQQTRSLPVPEKPIKHPKLVHYPLIKDTIESVKKETP